MRTFTWWGLIADIYGQLVSQLVLKAQSTTEDYIRAKISTAQSTAEVISGQNKSSNHKKISNSRFLPRHSTFKEDLNDNSSNNNNKGSQLYEPGSKEQKGGISGSKRSMHGFYSHLLQVAVPLVELMYPVLTRTLGGVYYCGRLRSLLMCPLSVQRYQLPLFVDPLTAGFKRHIKAHERLKSTPFYWERNKPTYKFSVQMTSTR